MSALAIVDPNEAPLAFPSAPISRHNSEDLDYGATVRKRTTPPSCRPAWFRFAAAGREDRLILT